jgi:polysaccharide pyruvyl transferase WcaK-like protein
VQSYRTLLRRLQELGPPVYLIEADGPDSFLEQIAIEEGVGIVPVYTPIVASASILANARLLISGRYHPSILASLGGTPCVFLGATSHKTQSLQRVLGYDEQTEFGIFPSDEEIERIVRLGRRYLLDGAELREAIRNVAERRSQEAGQLLHWIGDQSSEASRHTTAPFEMGTAT